MYAFLLDEFEKRFHRPPVCLVRAPAQIHLLGQCLPTADCPVLGLATPQSLWIALEPRDDRTVEVHHLKTGEVATFSLSEALEDQPVWAQQMRKVATALNQSGHDLEGWHAIVADELTSSMEGLATAALKAATVRAFSITSGYPWDVDRMLEVMGNGADQSLSAQQLDFTSALAMKAKDQHLVLMRSTLADSELLAFPKHWQLVVFDTMVRDQSNDALSLGCDVSQRNVHQAKASSADILKEEKSRIDRAKAAISQTDFTTFGEMLSESCGDIRQRFGPSSAEVESLIQLCDSYEYCVGVRYAGALSPGSVVCAVESQHVVKMETDIAAAYLKEPKRTLNIFRCKPTAGAQVVDKLPD